jgi:hypothetical protein
MIFLKDIENVRDETILRIRPTSFGDIAFSVRQPDGSIETLHYSQMIDRLRDEEHYEMRLARADYELNEFNSLSIEARQRVYNRVELTQVRITELQQEIAECQSEVQKHRRLRFFIHQKVEAFKAGLVSEFNVPAENKSAKKRELRELDTPTKSLSPDARSKRRRFTEAELNHLIPAWIEGVKNVYEEADPPITTTEAFKRYAVQTKNLFGEEFSWGTIKTRFYEAGAKFIDGGLLKKTAR